MRRALPLPHPHGFGSASNFDWARALCRNVLEAPQHHRGVSRRAVAVVVEGAEHLPVAHHGVPQRPLVEEIEMVALAEGVDGQLPVNSRLPRSPA